MDKPKSAARRLGDWGEEIAARYLHRQGLIVVERNIRTRFGELDLIARDGDTLVFIEVKVRRREAFGSPALAVNWRKRQRMSKLALTYVGDRACGIRFDIIAITAPPDRPPRLMHHRDAFEGVEPR
jgi:putative endonuclease